MKEYSVQLTKTYKRKDFAVRKRQQINEYMSEYLYDGTPPNFKYYGVKGEWFIRWRSKTQSEDVANDILAQLVAHGDEGSVIIVSDNEDKAETRNSNDSYRVRVTVPVLRVRELPDINSEIVDTIRDRRVCEVSAVTLGPGATHWGKTDAGWIALDFTAEI